MIFFGLIVGTVLTMFVVPVLYNGVLRHSCAMTTLGILMLTFEK
jgi:hypothetical protein